MNKIRAKKKGNLAIIKKKDNGLVGKEYYEIKKNLMCARYGLYNRDRQW